jgi:hypothetical protein
MPEAVTKETETKDPPESRTDMLPTTDVQVVFAPSQAKHLDPTNKIPKFHNWPRAGATIIFSSLILALSALLVWEKSRIFLDAHSGSISAIATVVIMMLTAFYAVYARRQWKVMEGQLEQMASTSEQTERLITEAQKSADAADLNARAAKANADALVNAERAWLTVKVGVIFIGEMEFRYIPVPVKNSGRTPARAVRMLTTSKLVAFPEDGWGKPGELPESFTMGDPTHTMVVSKRDFVIPPGGEFLMYGLILPDEWKKIQDREVSLYVYGYVKYLDTIEGREHKTCFCELYWVPGPQTGGREEFRFSGHLIPPAYICAT